MAKKQRQYTQCLMKRRQRPSFHLPPLGREELYSPTLYPLVENKRVILYTQITDLAPLSHRPKYALSFFFVCYRRV